MPKPQKTLSQKLRGGYYTPLPIARFLVDWAIKSPTDAILEPSCGDGIFLESAINSLVKVGAKRETAKNNIIGIEYYESEAEKARHRIQSKGLKSQKNQVLCGDFFHYCKQYLADNVFFDAIVGNPPFIRYQNFPKEQMVAAFAIMKRAGLHPNRLINTWIPFLIASTLLLKKDGRLAMVIPAELFQVNYAAEARLFLSETYKRITMVTFKKLVFEGVQEEIVLILGERDGGENHGIRVEELNNVDDLNYFNPEHLSSVELKLMDHSTEKWTQYFLDNKEIELLRQLKSNSMLPVSGEVIDVDVGVVTGENKYFVLSEQQVQEYRLEKYVDRIIGRSMSLKGTILSEKDWKEIVKSQQPSFLLRMPEKPYQKLPKEIKEYIKYGEEEKFHLGYKCRIRKHWWVVPSVWIPDAFMLRQVHGYPKLILNRANATSTDTIHRVKFINDVDGKTIVAAFLNSLTLAFAEVTGRSYGGGVLTFEPSEAERLPLPLKYAEEIDLNNVDRLLREKDIQAVLNMNDEILLNKGLNLSKREAQMLRNIWVKLRDRRINRKYTP